VKAAASIVGQLRRIVCVLEIEQEDRPDIRLSPADTVIMMAFWLTLSIDRGRLPSPPPAR